MKRMNAQVNMNTKKEKEFTLLPVITTCNQKNNARVRVIITAIKGFEWGDRLVEKMQ